MNILGKDEGERKLIKQLLSVCITLGMMIFLASTVMAKTTLTYANFPPAPTFPCIQMEHWKNEVEKRTDKELVIQTFPGSTLLGAKNMMRGVQTGQADIGCLSLLITQGVFPCYVPVHFSSYLPVAFDSTEVASRVMWDLFVKYQPKEFAKVKVLTGMFTSAPSHIMSKTPVRKLADMQGLELRASGSILKILNNLGA